MKEGVHGDIAVGTAVPHGLARARRQRRHARSWPPVQRAKAIGLKHELIQRGGQRSGHVRGCSEDEAHAAQRRAAALAARRERQRKVRCTQRAVPHAALQERVHHEASLARAQPGQLRGVPNSGLSDVAHQQPPTAAAAPGSVGHHHARLTLPSKASAEAVAAIVEDNHAVHGMRVESRRR